VNENDDLIINIFNVVVHEKSEHLEGHEDNNITIFDHIVFNSSYLKECLVNVVIDL
jgi:hypothetical protein